MDLLGILEVSIGIVLVYLVLSLVCTALLESVIAASGLKHKILRDSIERLVGKELADEIYRDPEVQALHDPNCRQPSYIPPDIFARSILDLATNGEWRRSGGLPSLLREKFVALASAGGPPVAGTSASEQTAERKLGRQLLDFLDEAGGDIAVLKSKIELWFDRTGDRSKGWFKRKLNLWLVILGFAIAAFVNADTVLIFQRLSDDPALRAAAVELAEQRVGRGEERASAGATPAPTLETMREQVGEIAPFIGWSMRDPLVVAWNGDAGPRTLLAAVMKVLGLLLTAFAISLGAPFWFDLLQKLVNVRKSVVAPKADETAASGTLEVKTEIVSADAVVTEVKKESEGPMAGFSPTAAKADLGNAYWLALAADLAYEADTAKVISTVESWGMVGHTFASPDQQARALWKGMSIATVDTQGFIAANDDVILVCFRGTEPTRPADIVTDVKYELVPAGKYGAGKIHEGFKAALDSVWTDIADQVDRRGSKRQSVWFTGHSLGGALAVLAASRYEREVGIRNDDAKKELLEAEEELENDPGNPALVGKRQQAIEKLRGRVAGVYTIGQPRVGDREFVAEFESRLGQSHIRVINNRDVVPRIPLRAMNYDHSGTVLYFDEFGRLHRDPGLWLRLLDTVVVSKAEMERAKEGATDHNSHGYVDLLDKARKSTSVLTRLALT